MDDATKTRFGAALRAARKTRYRSADDLAEAVTAAGCPITGAGVRAWENGVNPPRERETVWLLDELLGCDGRLAGLIGLARPGGVEERVTDLERAFSRMEAKIDLLLADRGLSAD